MLSVLNTPAPYGTAVLWWLGQMGLMVRLGDSLFCLDYYASPDPARQTPPPIPREDVRNVTCFLGSHNHLDHMDHESWRVFARNCPAARFVFPSPHLRQVLEDGVSPENCCGLDDGKQVRLGDVTIHALAAAHEFLDPDPETHQYPCLQYILEGNGVRIYHAGDTLRYEGMIGKLAAFGQMDAVLLPINGRDSARYRRGCIGNMTFQEAVDLAGELRPRLAIPGHWDMFRDNSADPHAFAEYMDAKYGDLVPCRIPQLMNPIVIHAGH